MRLDLDHISEGQAEAELMRRYALNPDVVQAQIDMTLMASPLAGPIRILKEIVSTDIARGEAPKPGARKARCGRCGDDLYRKYNGWLHVETMQSRCWEYGPDAATAAIAR